MATTKRFEMTPAVAERTIPKPDKSVYLRRRKIAAGAAMACLAVSTITGVTGNALNKLRGAAVFGGEAATSLHYYLFKQNDEPQLVANPVNISCEIGKLTNLSKEGVANVWTYASSVPGNHNNAAAVVDQIAETTQAVNPDFDPSVVGPSTSFYAMDNCSGK